MVAIITGIIIDTFGELRGTKADIENDESNVCFVCSLKRDQFERQGRKFSDHIELEHNRWNYIYYKVTNGCFDYYFRVYACQGNLMTYVMMICRCILERKSYLN